MQFGHISPKEDEMPTIDKSPLVLLALATLLFTPASQSQQPRGSIQNSAGDECWFTQTQTKDDTYFYDNGLTGNTYTLVFNDPNCMADRDGGIGLIVNKKQINYRISKDYSHSDADYQTRVREMYPSSLFQVRGQCIQSKTYPGNGVMVDYVVEDQSIVEVIHAMAIQGCEE